MFITMRYVFFHNLFRKGVHLFAKKVGMIFLTHDNISLRQFGRLY
jgi:hypothetical protein